MISDKPLLLFDGVCNLCNGVVQFVIEHDPEARYRFASLQSHTGQHMLKKHNLPTNDFESFVMIEKEKSYLKSAAALKLFTGLGGVWKLMTIFWVVPRPIRDFIYSLVANNRYRLFGKQNECWIPTPELKSRFLD